MSDSTPPPKPPTPASTNSVETSSGAPVNQTKKQDLSAQDCCDLQVAEYYRNLIAAEQTLINNRMTWLMTFQGFLFAAYAVAMNKDNDEKTRDLIYFIIPLAGLLMAFFATFGLIAAHFAINGIKDKFNTLNLSPNLVTPFSKSKTAIMGRIGAFSFPVVIIITWLIIFFAGSGHTYLCKN